MSETEKVNTMSDAIAWFKNELKDGKCHHDCPQCNANEFALTALREKAERSKGCEWCKVGQNNARTVWIDGSFDAFTGDSYGEGASRKGIIDRKVAYCPMCGKRLEVEHGN